MTKIRTVLGDIAPEELGTCQTHEHVICDQRMAPFGRIIDKARSVKKTYMILTDEDRAVEELEKYREAGGDAVVDVTTLGWGRNPEAMARVSKRSGVHIVATGGFYTEPHIPTFAEEKSIGEMVEWIVSEFEDGMDGTDIKIGLLKSGIYHGRIEGLERKCLRAVARGSLETGLAITTHTSGARRYEVPGGNLGRYHLEVLLEEGVSPTRLINGHTDERPDLGYLSELCDLGCFIQFDVIGKEHWLLDETRVDLLSELISRGYLEHILMGTDRCRQHELYPELGGRGYTHLLENFVPLMKAGGISEREIEVMLVENPVRALGVDV
ncbi:MAG: phosphotriesterase [Clostridia bacterium]